MSPGSRKRSSAFEDFPVSDPGRPTQGDRSLQDSSSQPKIPLPPKEEQPEVERIERLKPSQMLPDRFQPRHLLPNPLRGAFFSGQNDCYQTAAKWLTLARGERGYQGEVDRLLAMGESFEGHGQIKAITGAWVSTADGRYIFLIETGERRFWAACLRTVAGHLDEEPLLRVEVVTHPTRQRQVLENRHAEPPSAVGQACEIAALILAEMDIRPDPGLTDEFDYFRRAQAQRMPEGLWERVTPIMQLTRPRMVQLLNILKLPTQLLELADRYRLPERVLRPILAAPQEQRERMLRLSIRDSLTSNEVEDLARPAMHKARSTDPANAGSVQTGRVAVSGLRRFANALSQLDDFSRAQALDEIADELVARHQADDLLALLDELERLVQVRRGR
jgi:hypothetical protein